MTDAPKGDQTAVKDKSDRQRIEDNVHVQVFGPDGKLKDERRIIDGIAGR